VSINTLKISSDCSVYTITSGPLKTNTYVLKGRDFCVLIDVPWVAEQLIGLIKENNWTVDAIILTHGHFDHIRTAQEISTHFNAEIVISVEEKRILKRQNLLYFLHGGKNKLQLPEPSNTNFINFNLTDEIIMIDPKIKLHSFPGHTPGSLMVSYNDHVIFTGDTIYLDAVPASSLPESDPDLYHKSEKKFLERFSSAALLFPGHGAYGERKSQICRA